MKQILNTPYGKITIYRKGSGQKIIIIPGYCESITHNKELVDRLSRIGYDAFTYSQPRRGATTSPLNRQRDIILSVLNFTATGDQKVHAAAHSFGSAALLLAAVKDPNRFASLLLMQPSGLGGNQNFFQIVWRVITKTANNHAGAIRRRSIARENRIHSITHRQVVRAHATSTAIAVKNPFLSLKEAAAAIRHEVADDIAVVQELGIQVNVIKSHDDELFKTYDQFKYDQLVGSTGSYSSLSDRNAKHDTFWIHPERTIQLINTFIQQLHQGVTRKG